MGKKHAYNPKLCIEKNVAKNARKLVRGTYADQNYAKTSENSVHCHVPLIKFFWGLTVVIKEQIM
jgi:hypothetical protein